MINWDAYARLMRVDKPIGTLLLLWPTLWAVWLAGHGHPDWRIVAIFVAGVVLTRSAGCVINDFADRKLDGAVARTKQRPLAEKTVTAPMALLLFAVLMLGALLLVLQLNLLTLKLAIVGAGLMIFYPFTKRFTHHPQAVLGVAFAWGVPMAFAAQLNYLPGTTWWWFAAACLWPIAYDTFYALVDLADDKTIGIKSTAIAWGKWVYKIIAALQLVVLCLLAIAGYQLALRWPFYLSLILAAGLFIYQHKIAAGYNREGCFKAFLNNNWVGLVIFLGIWFSY